MEIRQARFTPKFYFFHLFSEKKRMKKKRKERKQRGREREIKWKTCAKKEKRGRKKRLSEKTRWGDLIFWHFVAASQESEG